MRRAVLLLTVPVLAAAAPARAQDASTEREYAVWSAVLDSVLGGAPATRIVVAETTRQGDRRREAGPFEERVLLRWPSGGGPVPADVMQAFRQANARPWPVVSRFHARVPVQLRSQAGAPVVPGGASGAGWEKVHDGGYPGSGGIASLSRVGFSADGRTALVYLGLYCGGLCGEEAYYLLARGADESWAVVRKYVMGQS